MRWGDRPTKQGAADDASAKGNRRVDPVHEGGTHLLVSLQDTPETHRIAGFSACFGFPEYEYGEKY